MNRKFTYGFLILLIVFLSGCSDWLDVNDSPNNPSEVDYPLVLPSGISSAAYVMGGRYQVLGALWSQHWTQSLGASQYSGLDSYDVSSSTYDDRQFGELYSGSLKALEQVRSESYKEGEWNYYLIATVMQCYVFQVLADLYDEIPFSDALKGDDKLEPVYESGSDVYDSLIVRIESALALDLENEDLKVPESEDILFNGDMDKWVAFANTLMLKILIRQVEVQPTNVADKIQALYDAEVDFLEEDVKMIQFADQVGSRNPLYDTEMNFFGNNPNLVMSNTLYSFLQDNADFERIDFMFDRPANGGSHKSLLQGNYNDPEEPAGTNSSSYSKPILTAIDPVYFMSLSEICFLQSEAMIRYGVGDYSEAKEKYEQGIFAAYNRLMTGYFSTDIINQKAQAFYNGGPYRFPSEGSDIEVFIESIIVQKWIALAGIQSLETFFEHNRTHYPKTSNVRGDNNDYVTGEFTISINNVTSNRFPKRLVFPASEYASNRNTPAREEVWQKVWWDVKQEQND